MKYLRKESTPKNQAELLKEIANALAEIEKMKKE